MKTKALVVLLVVAFAVLYGCAIKNPTTTPDPITQASAPLYVPDPRIVTASNAAVGIAGVAAPLNPWAGATDYLIKAGFGLAGIIAGFVAQKKNTTAAQASATQNQNMLNTVIKGVEDAGTAAVAVKTAIQNRATAAGVQPALDAVVQSLT